MVLRNAIAPIKDSYEFILLDCPPSLTFHPSLVTVIVYDTPSRVVKDSSLFGARLIDLTRDEYVD